MSNLQTIYVFNIANKQNCYAKCMQLILALEGKLNRTDVEWLEFFDQLDSGDIKISNFKFAESKEKNCIIADFEFNYVYKQARRINFNKLANDLFNKRISANIQRKYYFRVHSDGEDSDVVNFLYYALMLQHELMSYVKDRVFAFIVPSIDRFCLTGSGVKYLEAEKELKNFNNYYRFSSFTSFMGDIPKNVYGVRENSGLFEITRLNKGNESRSLIPAFLVNKESYELIINKKCKFGILKTDFNTNLESTKHRDGGVIALEIEEISQCKSKTGLIKRFINFSNNILAKAFSSKLRNKSIRHIFLNSFVELISNGVSALQYCLMSINIAADKERLNFYFNKLKCLKENDIDAIELSKKFWKGCIIETYPLYESIMQLLENIVNHSQFHKGIATFRCIDTNNIKEIVTIIADTNNKESIIDNFIAGDKCTEKLKHCKEKLTVSDFFTNYADMSDSEVKNAWKEFRENNLVACRGLAVFSRQVHRANGKALYRSSPKFLSDTNNDCWCINYTDKDLNEYYIPGTQVEFSNQLEEGGKEQSIYNPTYENYASFLDFSAELQEFEAIDPNNELLGQGQKDDLVLKYSNFWHAIFALRNCTYMDMFKLTGKSEAVIESVWKGFVLSVKNRTERLTVVLINISTHVCQKMDEVFTDTLLKGVCPNLKIICKTDDSLMYEFPTYPENVKFKELFSDYIFPFNVVDKNNAHSIFATLFRVADRNLLEGKAEPGFKLSNTHMRLGSKIHLDSFYQMATYFQRQSVAVKTAYALCWQLYCDKEIWNKIENILYDNATTLVLYGYETYSRSIVFSMREILNEFIKLKYGVTKKIEFALYQSERIDEHKNMVSGVYFSNPLENLSECNSLHWILVVPISTTLTTFKKMWAKIKTVIDEKVKNKKNIIIANLTAFWVINNRTISKSAKATELEKPYWQSMDTETSSIDMGDGVFDLSEKIYYTDIKYKFLVYKESKWNNPLTCEYCYPNDLRKEMPLLETDPSSTIPEQQYYLDAEELNTYIDKGTNDTRILAMEDSVYYGHLERSGNHYQYYINLAKYFNKQKEDISNWLKNQSDGKISIIREEIKNKHVIIVSPLNTGDIEFSLYVCNYLCDGMAETIHIDANKHFRSNVEAEYSDLQRVIKFNRKHYYFLYVDTAITTGNSFHRIENVIAKISGGDSIQCKRFSFDGVILLLNRMSEDSQRQYTKNGETFASYVNLDVSNIRTYGDSCVCCKLINFYEDIHRKSSTVLVANHYLNKRNNNKYINYNAFESGEIKQASNRYGFLRLIIAHYAREKLMPYVKGADIDRDKLKCAVIDILLANKDINSLICKYVANHNDDIDDGTYIIQALKVLCRPFFSYNFEIKSTMLSLLINVTESLLNYKNLDIYNDVGVENQIYKSLTKNRQVSLLNCLELLMNLNSNFLLRKESLSNILTFLNNYFKETEEKERFIKRYLEYSVASLKTGDDETKDLRTEYLLLTGNELKFQNELKFEYDIQNLNFKNNYFNNKVEQDFDFVQWFYLPLFTENNAVLYKALSSINSKWNKKLKSKETSVQDVIDGEWNESYLTAFRYLLKMDICYALGNSLLEVNAKDCAIALQRIYLLCKSKNDSQVFNATDFYNNLLKEIKELSKRLQVSLEKIYILGEHVTNSPLELPRQPVQEIKSVIYRVAYEDKMDVANFSRISDGFKKDIEDQKNDLSRFGYSIGSASHKQTVIIQFNSERVNENLEKDDEDILFLYLSLSEVDISKILVLIKFITLFRHSIQQVMSRNASSDTMRLKYNAEVAAQLATIDKAGDHKNTDEFDSLKHYLQNEDIINVRDTKAIWLLLDSYTNRRIARLFRKMINAKYLGKDEDNGCGDTLYIETNNPTEGKLELRTFDEAIKSRLNYFTLITNIIDFKVNENCCKNLKEFILELSEYEFISFKKWKTKDTRVYFSKENFIVCIFLDFCFSAIKHNPNKNDKVRIEDIAYDKFQYLLDNKDKRPQVHIYREEGSEFGGLEFDYLVLEDKFVPSKQAEEKFGMSIDSITWFVENFWDIYKKRNRIEGGSPKVRTYKPKIESSQNDKQQIHNYKLCLPILTKKKSMQGEN